MNQPEPIKYDMKMYADMSSMYHQPYHSRGGLSQHADMAVMDEARGAPPYCGQDAYYRTYAAHPSLTAL